MIAFIAVVALAYLVYRLSKRIDNLEKRVSMFAPKDKVSASTPEQAISTQSSPDEILEKMIKKPASAPTPTGPDALDRFLDWLKEDWLMKLGALLILIGFGWFVSFAFLQGWIGPSGRIALGLISGVIILLLGWWRIKKFVHQGSIFLVLGSTAILLTIFAAREFYELFTPVLALGVMFLSTAFVALASVKYKTPSLALASLVLAGFAPLLTNSPDPSYVGLFSYLLVVIVGTLWIVALTGWRMLTIAALLIVVFYSLPHISSFTTAGDTGVLLIFAYIFAAIFFITNTAGILKLKDKEVKDIVPDIVVAAGNGLLLLAWIMAFAPDVWKSLIIAAWMVVFTVGAFMIYRATGRKEPFYVYAGVGIAMLAAATSAELSGATLTIAYTIESGIIALITYIVLQDIKITKRVSLLLVGPMLLSVLSFSPGAWREGVFNEDFFVLFVLAATLFGLGLFFHKEYINRKYESSKFPTTLLVGGSVYAYILLWLSLHAGIESYDLATLVALSIYTIIGLAIYIQGRVNENKFFRMYGSVLIGFVVLRLLLIEIWDMNLSGRIVTFFVIGALLMSTAFIGRKNKKIQEPKTDLQDVQL